MKYLYEYKDNHQPTIQVRHARKSIAKKTMLKEANGREFVTIREVLDDTFGLETRFIDFIKLTK